MRLLWQGKTVIWGILLFFNSLVFSQNQLDTLFYDSGVLTEGLFSDIGSAHTYATRFTPLNVPVQLVAFQYYLEYDAQDSIFQFLVIDNIAGEPSENTLFGPVPIRPGKKGWNTVDVSSYNIVLNNDFFIAFNDLGPAGLKLGAENSPPATGRTYLADC